MSFERLVIDALREVEDLDGVMCVYVSNKAADQCPSLQKWLHIIVGEEQRRREEGDSPDFTYSQAGIEHVPHDVLIQMALYATGAIEWCYVAEKPTLVRFATELNKAFVMTMAKRLIIAGT